MRQNMTQRGTRTQKDTTQNRKTNKVPWYYPITVIIIVIGFVLTQPGFNLPTGSGRDETLPQPTVSGPQVETNLSGENESTMENGIPDTSVPIPLAAFGSSVVVPVVAETALLELDNLLELGENAGLFEGLEIATAPDSSELERMQNAFITAFWTEGRDAQLRMHEIAQWLLAQKKQYPENEGIAWVIEELRKGLDDSARIKLGRDATPWVANAYAGLKSLGYEVDAEILREDQRNAIRYENYLTLLAQEEKVVAQIPEIHEQESPNLYPDEEPILEQELQPEKAVPQDAPYAETETEIIQEVKQEQEEPNENGKPVVVTTNLLDMHVGFSPQLVLTTLRDLYEALRGNELVHTSWEVVSVDRVSEDLYEYHDERSNSIRSLSYTRTVITLVATDDPEFTMKFNVVWPLVGSSLNPGDILEINNAPRIAIRILQRIVSKDESE